MRRRREELKRQVLVNAYNAIEDLTFLVEQEVHDCYPYRGLDCIAGDILPILENQLRKFQDIRVALESEVSVKRLILY